MISGAIVTSWGTPIAGREAQALAVLHRSNQYWQRLEEDGRIAGQRLYTFLTGDQSSLRCLQIVEGDVDALHAITWEKDYKRIVAGALAVVHGFQVLTAVGGEPAFMAGPLELYADVMAELGFLSTPDSLAVAGQAGD